MTVPAGSAVLTACSSALMAAAVAALRNRYSSCAVSGVPCACSRVISPGVTQPPAVPVTELASPTTVSVGLPGTPVRVIFWPSGGSRISPGAGLESSTTWPGFVAH